MKLLLLAFATLLATAVGCKIHGCECPTYEILNNYPDFQERSYPDLVWVSAESTSRFGYIASSKNNLKLMRYWYKRNTKGLRINCTYPARELWTHKIGGIKVKTSFLLPSALYGDPPIPIDPTVKIDRQSATHLVARHFSGMPILESQWDTQAKILANSATKVLPNVDTSKYYACTYDPFWMPFKRTNEVWMFER
ncbi:heme-binding protein 1-like [Centruroides vittatus]|uniref:heme-binding protein 1-like n=1 Tax=Centruroides vittatus TaxID=120091 RepID=UPI00350F02F7